MKLIKIGARNFKGFSFEENLSELTLFVGGNFTGKTARIDAITVLLLGYLPKLGKSKTFRLSSGKEMEVWGEFDNGLKISRKWKLSGDSVKAESDVPKELSGFGPLAMMLDAQEYFGKGPQDRINYVFANCSSGLEAFTPEAIVSRVRGKVDAWTGFNADGMTAQQFVDKGIVNMTETAKASTDFAKRMEETVRGLTYLKSNDARGVTVDLTTVDGVIANLTDKISFLTGEISAKSKDHQAMLAARKRRQEIDAELVRTESVSSKLDRLRKNRDQLTADLEALKPPVDEDPIELLRKENQDVKMAAQNLTTSMAGGRNAIAKAEGELAQLDAKTECPYCGATGDGWKALKAAELATLIAELEANQALLTAKLADSNAVLASTGWTLNRAVQREEKYRATENCLSVVDRELSALEGSLGRATALAEEKGKLAPYDAAIEDEMAKLESARGQAKIERGTMENARTSAISRTNDLQRLAEAETSRDKAKAQAEQAQKAKDELREIQSEMVAAAFSPLLRKANGFFRDVIGFDLAYHNGEIGRWRDGVWVSNLTFSGIEELLGYAAIQAALASESPVRVMILDEMLRAHGEVFTKLIKCVTQSVTDGRLDNFVGIIPGKPENHHHLTDLGCEVRPVT